MIHVIGIGAGGYADLSGAARDLLASAPAILGAPRQLGLLPEALPAERREWPRPMMPGLRAAVEALPEGSVVLASGDPMFHGVGATLAREFGPDRFRVLPQSSSAALACARLGWPSAEVPVISLVSRPVAAIIPALEGGRRFLVLGRDAATPAEVAALVRALTPKGTEPAEITVLSELGGPHERVGDVQGATSKLNVIAVEPHQGLGRSLAPGLPDSAYECDRGQLTKQDVRAWTVAALAPRPGELLWDVGGGSGSIAIEWLRVCPSARAISFERNEVRREMIRRNAERLGTPELQVLGGAPEAFPTSTELTPATASMSHSRPNVVFIGGGLTAAGVVTDAMAALMPGGRMVANAVTVESERKLWELREQFGGEVRRIQVSAEHAVGRFTTMQPALPVTQWRWIKEDS